MTQSDQLRLAVFIDFDNIEIGVKNTMNASFDAGLVLEALKERGEVVSKLAYSDWQRAGGYSRALTQHAIRMVQRNMTPGGDKNGADINLALDALEMAFTHPHINAFVIVGGDSDFISLIEKLKQYGKKVYVVGGRQFTSGVMQRNCHEFIAYENLASAGGGGRRTTGGRGAARPDGAKIETAVPLVKRALAVLSERDVSPQLGLLKSTLLQLDSTFSEKSFGAGSFREFAQKLEKAGVLSVNQGKGGWLVGPPIGGPAAADVVPADEADNGDESAAAAPPVDRGDRGDRGQAGDRDGRGDRGGRGPAGPAPEQIGQPADGVRELGLLLSTAEVRRWPLYLRNLKQILKQSASAFDERAYGFANLGDLARAAHRAGILRIERDRQGNIRMFQGALPDPGAATPATGDAETEGGASAAPEVDVTDVVEAPDATLDATPEPAVPELDDDHDPGDVNGNRVGGASKKTARKAPARRRSPARKKSEGAAPDAAGRRPRRSPRKKAS